MLGVLTLTGVAAGMPVRADNCNPDNLADCKTAPNNISGTLGAAGVLTGLGLLNGLSGGNDGSTGEPGPAPDKSGSYLDDM